MIVPVQIENIDTIRLREGIDDVELHEDISRLRVGDHVRLTFLAGANLRETLSVRITRIHGAQFRGRLTSSIARPELLGLRCGGLVSFTAGHIHSIARPQPALKRERRGQED